MMRGHGLWVANGLRGAPLVVVLLGATAAGGAVGDTSPSGVQGFVTVSGMRFLDGEGKPLILHGINVENKDRKQGYTGDLGTADFAAIRAWGMNCIRLTIFWDGLEPEPGKIDSAYLDRIARLVESAKTQGLYVLLDMHQDLYSVKFLDGAPAWATLDEGNSHTPGRIWSDAYFASRAVQAALDNFWANKPGPDGLGLQEHYARTWQAVARRFASESVVMGYDLMNEPAPGKDFPQACGAGLLALVGVLAKRDNANAPGLETLGAAVKDPDARRRVIQCIQDPEVLSAMLEAIAPITQDFERTRLVPFYSKVAGAIREVDSRHILFLEPCLLSGTGVRTALTPLSDAQGRRDPQQAYAPHAYDITTDTSSVDPNGNPRVKLILDRHEQAARRLQMPMLVGEWGAFYLDPKAAEPTRFIVGEFHRLGCGDAYWSYSRELQTSPLLPALRRTGRK